MAAPQSGASHGLGTSSKTTEQRPFDPDALKIVKQWVEQLADPVVQAAIVEGGQVEIRLFTHQGKVRKNPVVVLNAGPSTMA